MNGGRCAECGKPLGVPVGFCGIACAVYCALTWWWR